jgi:hypothetical protein
MELEQQVEKQGINKKNLRSNSKMIIKKRIKKKIIRKETKNSGYLLK